MLATSPLSSPSHYAGTRSVASDAVTVSRAQVLLVVAAVVVIAAIAAPAIVIPVVVIGGIMAAAGYGLLGLGEALEPLAEGRVAAATITYVPFNR
jgi:hypothetical protein